MTQGGLYSLTHTHNDCNDRIIITTHVYAYFHNHTMIVMIVRTRTLIPPPTHTHTRTFVQAWSTGGKLVLPHPPPPPTHTHTLLQAWGMYGKLSLPPLRHTHFYRLGHVWQSSHFPPPPPPPSHTHTSTGLGHMWRKVSLPHTLTHTQHKQVWSHADNIFTSDVPVSKLLLLWHRIASAPLLQSLARVKANSVENAP